MNRRIAPDVFRQIPLDELRQQLVRLQIETEIERLIGLLDAMDPDPDLEDGCDLESYLAGCLHATGLLLDAEGDVADDEPSLGWTGGIVQGGMSWRGAVADNAEPDRENDGDDLEPEEWDGEQDAEEWHQPANLLFMGDAI